MSTPARICREKIKDDSGKVHACQTPVQTRGAKCPRQSEHMLKYRTGFCAIGFCEGHEVKDGVGKYALTCSFWKVCPCKCHTDLDKMFAAAEMPRQPVENPKYVKPKSIYVMPDPVEVITKGEDIPEKRSLLEDAPTKEFIETSTGGRQKGQLEYQVLEVCRMFTKGELEVEQLTPRVIGEHIEPDAPPSAGAIGAVFDRWVKMGFANCERGPVRFVSFTVEGLQHGLDYMKAKARRERKLARAKQERGGRLLRG